MAKLVFEMNVSLDGYIDHTGMVPSPTLFRHFLQQVASLTGSIYGRRTYEVMSYWDDAQPDWDEIEQEFATAWRAMPKWVVSRTLTSVGPNATLITGDPITAISTLKAELTGEIAVAGPNLAQTLSEAGLIDEYRLVYHPVALGQGKPFFPAPRPRLRLIANDQLDEDTVRLTYVPT